MMHPRLERIGIGGLLNGVALDAKDRPLGKTRVVIRSSETLIRTSTTTDEQGRFSVPALPAGSYRVSVSLPVGVDPYRYEHEGSVEIQENQESSMTVRVRPRS